MGFSYDYFLTHDGGIFTHYGDIVLRQDANGDGKSGVCTTEFTFSVPADEYNANKPPSGASVTFSILHDGGVEKIMYFYISQRTKSGGKVAFKCYDKMILSGKIIPDTVIGVENGKVREGLSEKITAIEIVDIIKSQLLLTDTDSVIKSMGYFAALEYDRASLSGKTCRSILEQISNDWCGYFKISREVLGFVPYGGAAYSTGNVVNSHAAIEERGERSPVTCVRVTGNNNVFIAGDQTADVFSTVNISSEFASDEYANALLTRMQGYEYKSWRCSKCIIADGIPETDASISFSGDPDGTTHRIANSLSMSFTDTGIYLTCGRNDITENEYEYLGYLSRKIENKIGDGETLGNNTMITRYQGIIHLGEKKKDEETGKDKQDRYGYSKASKEGIVEFDGAIMSNVIPKNAKVEGDKVTMEIGDKKYRFMAKKDTSGNITELTREEVKE